MATRLAAALLMWAVLIPIAHAEVDPAEPASPTAPALTAQERIELSKLRMIAVGRDYDAAIDAIDRLRRMGPPGGQGALAGISAWLSRDLATIQRALPRAASPDAQAAEAELVKLREEALAHIAALTKEPTSLETARANYQRLESATKRVAAVLDAKAELIEPMARRTRLLRLYRSIPNNRSTQFSEASEDALYARVTEALGAEIEAAVNAMDADAKEQPQSRSLQLIRHQIMARKVVKMNTLFERSMSPSEIENARRVNHYRAVLGRMPLEFDPRLVQAARRHCKEMVDLGYFSHMSPVEEHRGFRHRAAKAGYNNASGENIAAGYASGEAAFWGWFNSPGHHQGMVSAGNRAMGVGRWNNTWTQVFGRKMPFALTDPQAARDLKIEGEILHPRG